MTTKAPTFSWNKEDWAPLSEMADGFDEYRPAYSPALVGHQLALHPTTTAPQLHDMTRPLLLGARSRPLGYLIFESARTTEWATFANKLLGASVTHDSRAQARPVGMVFDSHGLSNQPRSRHLHVNLAERTEMCSSASDLSPKARGLQ
jgi:hypothetical protein